MYAFHIPTVVVLAAHKVRLSTDPGLSKSREMMHEM